MTTLTRADDKTVEGFERRLEMAEIKQACWLDPKPLLEQMRGLDPTLQEEFGFNMTDIDGAWGWQRLVVDWIMGTLSPEDETILKGKTGWWKGYNRKSRKFIILKARQLGITWVAVAIGLWYILFKPGSNVVCYSHGLDESKKLIARAWLMFNSLPPVLRSHVIVVVPLKAEIPSEKIVLKHKDGKLSTFQALPDTAKAGHGDTITFGIMDETARQVYAKGIYTAVNPAVSRGGTLVIVSTANGVSNLETGEGNFFHQLWYTRVAKRLNAIFLPWNLHPERDDEWYENEAMALDHMERNQQYPLNPDNAFILSGDLYFDPDALEFYRGEAQRRRALYRGKFVIDYGKGGKLQKIGGGWIEVLSEPRDGVKYALSADTASGRSQDYSCGHVIDLDNGDIVAEIRGKMPVQDFADQLKLLGRWYNTAVIIPERTGIGEAVVSGLRNNANGLKAYGNIYQHQRPTDIKKGIAGEFGLPMGPGTRALVLDKLRSWVKDRKFPFLTEGMVDELGTFIYRESGTSPRAMDGCNDDRVMSLAMAVFMYDHRGEKPETSLKKKVWKKLKYTPPPTRTF